MSQLYAGVDLGGTTITCAMATGDGTIVAQNMRPTGSADGPKGVLKRIAEMVFELSDKVGAKPDAVGAGIPGLIDLKHGVTKFLPNFPTNWPDVPVSDILTSKLDCEVFILNDVRTATLGEMTYGRGKTAKSMVFFALGTGVGGGVVVNGKLVLGPMGAAGELGHHTIIPDGLRCGCGNRGCLETLASGPAISAEGVRLMLSGMAPNLHRLVDGDASKVNTKVMVEAVEAGDKNVRDAIVQAGKWLGIGVANIVVTLHPDLIVIGGGVAQIGALLLDEVKKTMHERVGMIPTDGIRVEQSALGMKAGILGAIALAKVRGKV